MALSFSNRQVWDRIGVFFLAACVSCCWAAAGIPNDRASLSKDLFRDGEPVILTGAALPDLLGTKISDIGLFRFDPAKGGFVPIPFQVDERLDKVFNQGSPLEFTEKIYDLNHEEDGILDADDEVVFLFKDTGNQAPAESPWPEYSSGIRFEVQVVDPRPGNRGTSRWVYVHTGSLLARSDVRYIQWDGQNNTTISTNTYQLGYAGNWLLTEFRLFAPCGNGADLMDRVKGRAKPSPNLEEDEEGWNTNSTFLGSIVGPVRAIRYIRGAQSGINTIHYDIVYPNLWIRQVNLRVHPVAEVRMYIDWLPRTNTLFFTPQDIKGVFVDGRNDTLKQTAVPMWTLIGGTAGGLGVLWSLPPSPLYQSSQFFYRDDSTYNDQVKTNPDYGDDDNSAYGAHGITVKGLTDSNITPIRMSFRAYPLCIGSAWAELGPELQQVATFPIQTTPRPEYLGGPVTSLKLSRVASDIDLTWQNVQGIVKYRVYASEQPASPSSAWSVLGEIGSSPFTDSGAGTTLANRFYSVVSVRADGKELW